MFCFVHDESYCFAFIKSSRAFKTTKMAAKAKVRLELMDVFKDFDNFVDMNSSIYRKVN